MAAVGVEGLAGRVRAALVERNLKPAEVADGLNGTRNRATFYRILSGETTDPRISTAIDLATGLRTNLDALLGHISTPDKDPDLQEALKLGDDDKGLALMLMRTVIDSKRKTKVATK